MRTIKTYSKGAPFYNAFTRVEKTLGSKLSRAEIKGVNVSSSLPDVERFS